MRFTKFILCIQVLLLSLTAVSRNVGIGTNTPTAKLHVADKHPRQAYDVVC